MTLPHLDEQLRAARGLTDAPQLSEMVWDRLATTVHREVIALDDVTTNRLRLSMLIPPERYVEELSAFQGWMDIAHANAGNPVIVRAQVMTQLYVSFVWLRDSVMKPLREAMPPESATRAVIEFLESGSRRRLRNAIAHGRWCYLPNFDGLEYWAEAPGGQPHERFEVSATDLEGWQLLSRGTAIAILLALAESS